MNTNFDQTKVSETFLTIEAENQHNFYQPCFHEPQHELRCHRYRQHFDESPNITLDPLNLSSQLHHPTPIISPMHRFLKSAPYTPPQYRVNGIRKQSLDMMDHQATSTILGENGSAACASADITDHSYNHVAGEDSSGDWFSTSQEFDLTGIGSHLDLNTSQEFNFTAPSSQLDLDTPQGFDLTATGAQFDLDTSQVSDLAAINAQFDLEELPTT